MEAELIEGNSLRVMGAAQRLIGRVRVPGDKAIAHRAALLGAIAEGPTEIRGWPPGDDCKATLEVVRGLGVPVEQDGDTVTVWGTGPGGLREPDRVLFCGGSGTTMRLAAGLLAGQPFLSILDGNAQLRGRPMGRVADPLRAMGATIQGREGGRLAPLCIGGGGLQAIDYTLPVASGQVKTALLLAGLFAEGRTRVHEPHPTRDHTERMLAAMGANIRRLKGGASVGRSALQGINLTVPGDISSAAFLLAAAAIVPDSQVRIEGLGINPTRDGILVALRAMGAEIRIEDEREEHGEPVADVVIESRPLQAITVAGDLVPRMIDELPVLAVVASQAVGTTEVRDAGELRVKESDRISTLVSELSALGVAIEARPDGFVVHGPTPLIGASVLGHGDHRIVMALLGARIDPGSTPAGVPNAP
jgi:3-phosphoshikimate 1-carboxyvinyltransferase